VVQRRGIDDRQAVGILWRQEGTKRPATNVHAFGDIEVAQFRAAPAIQIQHDGLLECRIVEVNGISARAGIGLHHRGAQRTSTADNAGALAITEIGVDHILRKMRDIEDGGIGRRAAESGKQQDGQKRGA